VVLVVTLDLEVLPRLVPPPPEAAGKPFHERRRHLNEPVAALVARGPGRTAALVVNRRGRVEAFAAHPRGCDAGV
jgi:hypothetical protein